MGAVQFRGKEKTLNGYCAYDIEAWGLFQGAKQLICSGSGEQELSQWLQRLAPASGYTCYTLRMYRDLEDVGEINPQLEPSASFKFELTERSEYMSGFNGADTALLQRLEKIEAKISGNDEDDDEEFNLNKIVMGWLEQPEKIAVMIGAVKSLFGRGDIAANALGTIGSTQPEGVPAAGGEKVQRLSAALDKLEKYDPELIEHLERLAIIAETKPNTFKLLIGGFDGI